MSASKAQLVDAAKKLNVAWQQARLEWDDAAARSFQARYLDPLTPALRQASQAIDALSEANYAARRACS